MNKLKQFKFQGWLMLLLSLLMTVTALFCKVTASPDYLEILVFGTIFLTLASFYHSFSLAEKIKKLEGKEVTT